MKALILAAGFGTRLKEVIHDRPKVMAPVKGKPFLEYVLTILRKNGVEEVVIAIGYLGSYIKEYFGNGNNFGLKIFYSIQKRPIGTGGAVKLAESEKYFDRSYFVVNGDTYLNCNFRKIMDFHLHCKAQATIATVYHKNIQSPSGLVIVDKDKRITRLTQKPKEAKSGLVNAGLYVFSPGITRIVKNHQRFSLEEDVFPKIIKQGNLYAYQIKEDFIDIGTPQNYYNFRKLMSKKKEKTVEVQTPVRISFAGGGTDLAEFYNKYKGAIIGGTINLYSHIKARSWDMPFISIKLLDFNKEEIFPANKYLPYDGSVFDHYKAVINKLHPSEGVHLTVWADYPAGSGLGSSSSITVGLIKALSTLQNKKLNNNEIARLAAETERQELNIPGGLQDQYQASFGGLNLLEFSKKGVSIEKLPLSDKQICSLEQNLLLFFIGGKREEKAQQTHLKSEIKTKEKTIESLLKIKEIVYLMQKSFKVSDFTQFGRLLDKSWMLKKQSSGKISNIFIDKIYNIAKKHGALGGKLLGSGGGGCLLLYVPQEFQNKLIRALEKFPVRRLPFNFENKGVEAKIYDN